jgi:hypothetical protein
MSKYSCDFDIKMATNALMPLFAGWVFRFDIVFVSLDSAAQIDSVSFFLHTSPHAPGVFQRRHHQRFRDLSMLWL